MTVALATKGIICKGRQVVNVGGGGGVVYRNRMTKECLDKQKYEEKINKIKAYLVDVLNEDIDISTILCEDEDVIRDIQVKFGGNDDTNR